MASLEAKSFWTRYREEYRELTKLGIPVLMTQLGVILVSFADTIMVGAYSVEALASSAFVNSVFLIPLVMLSGFAAGITPLIGALYSKDEHYKAGRIAKAGLQINSIVSLVFTLIMAVLYFYVDCFGQPEELLPLIRPYYLTMLATLFPMALFNALSQTSNGLTDTRTPMWFMVGAVLLNIFGNWLLIFGNWGFPRLGLTGAGFSTVFARICGLTGLAFMFGRARRYKACREGIVASGALGAERRKVWLTSYPVMIQTGVECSLWSFGAVVCGWFGKIQLASFQVVNTISQLGFMIYQSIGVAVSIRVANYCGLHNEQGAGDATRAGMHINLLLATFSSGLMLLLSRPLIGLFTQDVDVMVAAQTLIWPLVLYQYVDAAQMTYMNAIRGTSFVKPMLWIALISYVVVGIPSSLLFSVTFGGENLGVYYSFNVALLVATILSGLAFKKIRI